MLASAGELLAEKLTMNTGDITPPAIHDLLQGWDYQSAVIASVVPARVADLEAGIAAPCHFLSSASPHGLSFDLYPDEAHLGADRIANVMGMYQAPRFPAIAIDLGTAVTYDVLLRDSEGGFSFAGGVIAAGLSSLRTCLTDRTALLPAVDRTYPHQWLGKDTKHALQSGALLGFVGMVRETIGALSSELKEKPYIMATGGDADLLAEKIPQLDEIDVNLTFKGLLELSKRL